MWVINDMAILASVTLERALAEWTKCEHNVTERKIYPWGTKLVNSMIAQAHADLRELLRPPQTSLSRFLSSRIATVGEHNMNEANKR